VHKPEFGWDLSCRSGLRIQDSELTAILRIDVSSPLDNGPEFEPFASKTTSVVGQLQSHMLSFSYSSFVKQIDHYQRNTHQN